MKKILLISIVAALGLPARGHADFNRNARGTTTADFLKLGVGARADAMAGAFSASADDATALYWNPAALLRIPVKSGSATLMHAPYVASTFYDYLGYAKNLDDSNAWGTSLQYYSAGSITETNESGFSQGSFSPYDLALSVGAAHQFDLLSVGVSAKYIRSQIITSAQTMALDFGVLSRPFLHERLRLAAVATNIGGKMKFEQESSRLPLAYRLGAAYQLSQWWLVDADAVLPVDDSPYAAVAAEHLWPVGRRWNVAARAGLTTQSARNLNGPAGITFGVGMDFETVAIDYAMQPLGDLGLTHRLSLSFRFLPAAPILPKKQTNLHAPNYPDYNDVQPYFDDSPSLREMMQ